MLGNFILFVRANMVHIFGDAFYFIQGQNKTNIHRIYSVNGYDKKIIYQF